MADRPSARRYDGVTIAPGTSRGKSLALLASAVALACVALLVLFGSPGSPPPPEPPRPAQPLAVAGAGAVEKTEPPAPEVAAPPPVEPAPAPAGGDAAPEPPGESAEGVVPSGIGLFPPPGTDPIKIGIVVPDDFVLPEGYLRHYQVTDDGQELPPILLFHPDYEILDDAGKPIPLPANRVVPPELAPPGLPIRMLVVPKPRDE